MSIQHHGSCLCGGIRFTIQGPLAPILVHPPSPFTSHGLTA